MTEGLLSLFSEVELVRTSNYKLETRRLFPVSRWSYFQAGSKEERLRCCQEFAKR